MPSPFPGMDPYLEHPDVFPGLHDRLIAYLSETMQPGLPAPYFADINRRAWVEVSERYIGPDVDVLRPRDEVTPSQSASGSVAVAAPPATEPIVIHVPHDERRETFLEVYTGSGKDRRLVTTIEVLSPSNKMPGEQGRELYLRKQREVLESKVHLVEIDLLRMGEHTTAVPHDRLARKIPSLDYHVSIHHFDNLEDYFVYPVQLPERLPTIRIPLLPGDGDVAVDLQAVFDRCYDTGPYRREIRYGESEVIPPLAEGRVDWAKQLLEKTA